MDAKQFKEVYPNYEICDLETAIVPGKPKGPSHVQVITRQRAKMSFRPASESDGDTLRFTRERKIDYQFLPVGGGKQGPECRFSPFALTFERDRDKVGMVHHQSHYKFDTSRQIKSTIEQTGADALLHWVVRLWDTADEEITRWSPMFTHSHPCSWHWSGSLRQSSRPINHLSWDVLINEVGRVQMWPRYATYWYEYC